MAMGRGWVAAPGIGDRVRANAPLTRIHNEAASSLGRFLLKCCGRVWKLVGLRAPFPGSPELTDPSHRGQGVLGLGGSFGQATKYERKSIVFDRASRPAI